MDMVCKVAGDFIEERQIILRKLMNGFGRSFPVSLLKEEDNPYDKHAVAVFSCKGEKIGYIPKEIAEDIGYCLPILERSDLSVEEDKNGKIVSKLNMVFKEEE